MADKKKDTSIVTIEVTVRGHIDLEVPTELLPAFDELANKLPVGEGQLPNEVAAQFEEKFLAEVADMDYEITDID